MSAHVGGFDRRHVAEKAIWGSLDPNKQPGRYGHSREFYDAYGKAKTLRIIEARAVLGISEERAFVLHGQFMVPELRRSEDFVEHCALVLREGSRLMANPRDAQGRFISNAGAK